MRVRILALLCVVPSLLLAAPVASTEGDSESVTVVASERYIRGRVHRFALGGGYRDLWEAEIQVPLLDLSSVGGGLTPTGRFGGLQTAVLGFKGENGRLYSFRGTDKDPSKVLDPELHDTVVQTVVQDQMAAQHPGGPLAVSVISDAAGVPTIHETMVVMPDVPELGEYRAEFAGMVGTFFEFPQPRTAGYDGFHGASEIIDHEELYERLARGHDDAVNAHAFLRARLLDILLGDFDRHRKQWRWAKFPDDAGWQPIPEDRDMAFVRYEGVGPRVAYLYVPILQDYGPEYPWIKGLTLHGWEQDRWILAKLGWDDWDPIVRDLQDRITDDVIDRAIEALPAIYAELDGNRLRVALRGRRDRLRQGAQSFYKHLAREVDVQETDAAEAVTVERLEDGRTQVEVVPLAGSAIEPVYRRVFDPDETRDLRIYLRGGDDQVRVEGDPSPIRLRLIADGGAKTLEDPTGEARVYDATDSVSLLSDAGTKIDRRPYVPPDKKTGFADVENIPPRDWGFDLIPIPQIGYERDVGAFLGAGAVYTRYGFRKDPWSSQHRVTAGYATEAERPRVRYRGAFRPENSKVIAMLDMQYSGIEILRFYGFGNETSDGGSDRNFRVKNEQAHVRPTVTFPLPLDHMRVRTGPWMEYSRTHGGDRLVNDLDPYGSGRFGSVGASATFEFDTRESLTEHSNLAFPLHENPAAGYPTEGVYFEVTGQVSPPLWDVDDTWGSVDGSVSGYHSFGANARATIGLRVGGRSTFGRTPYTEAAYIGGGEFFSGSATVRGFRAQRFAGDHSVYGNADLRIFLARLKIIVPGDFGVMGFGDVGRVFEDGKDSKDWHPAGGGGIWFSPLTRTNTISLAVADTSEETLFYMRFGFHY